MTKIRLFILKSVTVFLIGILNPALGQSITLSDNLTATISQNTDRVFVHLNKNVFVTGEYMYFKAYVVNNHTLKISKSKILYFDLIDFNNNAVKSWRCNVNNGIASSKILIPAIPESGVFTLFAYTNRMLNFPRGLFFSTNIFVTKANDPSVDKVFYPGSNDTIEKGRYYPYPSSIPAKEGIEILNLKESYRKREKIQFEIVVSGLQDNEIADLSATVKEKQPFEFLEVNNEISFYLPDKADFVKAFIQNLPEPDQYNWLNPANINILNFPFLPEEKGFILSGKLTEKEQGLPVQNETVLISCKDTISTLKYCKTDKNGRFQFLLGKFYDNKEIILHTYNSSGTKNQYKWHLDLNKPVYENGNMVAFHLSEEDREYLNYCRKLWSWVKLAENVYICKKHNYETLPCCYLSALRQ